MKKSIHLTLLLAILTNAAAAVTPTRGYGEDLSAFDVPTNCELRISNQGSTLVCPNVPAPQTTLLPGTPSTTWQSGPQPYAPSAPVYNNPQTFSVQPGSNLSLIVTGATVRGILSKPSNWNVSWTNNGSLETLLFQVPETAPVGTFACVQTQTTSGQYAPICVFSGSVSGFITFQ